MRQGCDSDEDSVVASGSVPTGRRASSPRSVLPTDEKIQLAPFGEPDPQSELTVAGMVDAGTHDEELTADISEVSAEPPFDEPALRGWGSCPLAELCGVEARTVTLVPGGVAQGRSSNATGCRGHS